MDPTNDVDQQWPPCQAGEVGQLVHHLRTRRNARHIRRGVAALVLLLAAASTGYYFVVARPGSEPNYGGIVCSRIHELAPRYMAGDLDAETAARIDEHLRQCEECQQWMRKMMSDAPRHTDRQPASPAEQFAGQRRDPSLAQRLALGQLAAR